MSFDRAAHSSIYVREIADSLRCRFLIFVVMFVAGCSGGGASAPSTPGGMQAVLPVSAAAQSPLPTIGKAPGSGAQGDGIDGSATPTTITGPSATSSPAAALSSDPSAINLTAPTATNAAATFTFRYVFPVSGSVQSNAVSRQRFGAAATAAHRVLASSGYTGYTSPAAPPITINLSVTPLGGATVPSSGTCTVIPAGTSGTCTVAFTASPGPTALSGTLTESGRTIATFGNFVILQPNATNTITFTANPVVNSVTLVLSGAPVPKGGTALNVPLAVNAYDANGNIIAGSANYSDAFGNPLALQLSVKDNQGGGHGAASINGPTLISAPSQTPILVHYDGNALNSAQINVASSSPIGGALGTATLTIVPTTVHRFAVTTNSDPFYMTETPDGNFWYTEGNTNNIGRLTPPSTVTEFPVPTANSKPIGIALGSDGYLWICELNGNKMAKLSPTTGVFTEYPLPTGSSGPGNDVLGPDGNIWFTESYSAGNRLAEITPTGQITEYPFIPTGNSAPDSITFAPDGNLWFTEFHGNNVGRMTPAGVITEYPIPTANSGAYQIGVGADGNIWVPEPNNNKITKVTMAGAVSEITGPAGASFNTIVAGPDGNTWSDDFNNNAIAKITPGNVFTEYSAGGLLYNGQIILGRDGNFYVSDYNRHIDELVY